MHAPSLSIPATNLLPAGELITHIHQALNDRFTGMAQVNFQAGKTLALLILNGKVRQIYLCNHRVPDLNWELPLNMYGEGTLEFQSMPARGMMFRKIVLEELEAIPSQLSGTNQLKTMFSLAGSNPSPTLFHIQWESAEGFVLVAGRSIPLCQAVLLTLAGAEERLVALDQISAWDETQCKVTVYRGDIKSQAWLEVHLNILLECHCRNILNHYGQLTGTVMVRAVLQGLAVLAEVKGWNISTKDNRLEDISIFASAADAANAYREILSAIRIRIEPIIGSSLTQNLMKQSIESTRDIYKTIQEIFGLSGEV